MVKSFLLTSLWVAFTHVNSIESTNKSDLCFSININKQEEGRSRLPEGIFITELMPSNSSSITDQAGEYSDWIEILNNTPNPIDLSNYFISDNLNNLQKYRFPNDPNGLTLAPYSSKIIWASGEIQRGGNHLPFSLSAGGEMVILTNPDGITLIDSISFPEMYANHSFGLLDSLDRVKVIFGTPTPDTININENFYLGYTQPPILSHSSGIYPIPFSLTVEDPNEQSTTLFTSDNSWPAIDNLTGSTYYYRNYYREADGSGGSDIINVQYLSNLYLNPILIDNNNWPENNISLINTTYHNNLDYQPDSLIPKVKNIVVKSHKANYLPGNPAWISVFQENPVLDNSIIPKVNIIVPTKDLFDFNSGIYVAGAYFDHNLITGVCTEGNYSKNNDDWVRDGLIEFFNSQNSIQKSTCNVRIQGRCTRSNPYKSLRIKSQAEFSENIFQNSLQKRPSSNIVLRNSGNDQNRSLIRDALCHSILSPLNISTLNSEPVNLFLSGEYWGLHFLNESYDAEYFSKRYKLPEENIDLIQVSYGTEAEEGTLEDFDKLNLFLSNNNFNLEANYDSLRSLIDIESFIDFQAAELFIGNTDWGNNNIRLWKYKGDFSPFNNFQDNKWRWAFYDGDLALNYHYGETFNAFDLANDDQMQATMLFRNIKNNPDFKNQFVNRFSDLLNSSFLADNTQSHLNRFKSLIQPSIGLHIKRWNIVQDSLAWLNELNLLQSFFSNRPQIVGNQIQSFFQLADTYNLAVTSNDSARGFVRVNTIDIKKTTPGIPNDYSTWTGKYFKNIPIRIVAKANKGSKFSHWEYNGQILSDSAITILTDTNVSYAAFFEEEITTPNPKPKAFELSHCSYKFFSWSSTKPAGEYPANMRFVYYHDTDPTLTDKYFADSTFGLYNHSSRTRINGLGDRGVSFINTTGSNINVGYPSGKLGGAVLALDTREVDSVVIAWKGRTILANERKYAIRLMYRLGDTREFNDFDPPVEYAGAMHSGDSAMFSGIKIPQALIGQPYVQLLWRYYYVSGNSGSRDQLAIDDIEIKTTKLNYSENSGLLPNYSIINSLNASENYLNSAQNSVILMPGFETQNAQIFKVEIRQCGL